MSAPSAVEAAGRATTRLDAVPDELRTEFAFVLPRGYVDAAGRVHRDGVMRLARARDELDWDPSHPSLTEEFRQGSYRG